MPMPAIILSKRHTLTLSFHFEIVDAVSLCFLCYLISYWKQFEKKKRLTSTDLRVFFLTWDILKKQKFVRVGKLL